MVWAKCSIGVNVIFVVMGVWSAFGVPAIVFNILRERYARVGGVVGRFRTRFYSSSSAAWFVGKDRQDGGIPGGVEVSERDNVRVDVCKVSELSVVSIDDSNNVVRSSCANVSEQ